jgi:P27 family predicted phage terminase small subunit
MTQGRKKIVHYSEGTKFIPPKTLNAIGKKAFLDWQVKLQGSLEATDEPLLELGATLYQEWRALQDQCKTAPAVVTPSNGGAAWRQNPLHTTYMTKTTQLFQVLRELGLSPRTTKKNKEVIDDKDEFGGLLDS